MPREVAKLDMHGNPFAQGKSCEVPQVSEDFLVIDLLLVKLNQERKELTSLDQRSCCFEMASDRRSTYRRVPDDRVGCSPIHENREPGAGCVTGNFGQILQRGLTVKGSNKLYKRQIRLTRLRDSNEETRKLTRRLLNMNQGILLDI